MNPRSTPKARLFAIMDTIPDGTVFHVDDIAGRIRGHNAPTKLQIAVLLRQYPRAVHLDDGIWTVVG